MTNPSFSDKQIIDSWHRNAAPWTAYVRDGRIESRRLVTDRAMVEAVLARSPRTVLDIGCGEGWLARELSVKGLQVIGTDVVPELIEQAGRSGGGDFRLISYEEIATGKLGETADVVACNFSLLGKESVEGIFQAAPSLLTEQGVFIVQTLHPHSACGELAYRDGWRKGTWAGLGDGVGNDFSDPAPWYFRTVNSWLALYQANGLRLREIREPVHPNTGRPASIIFIGEKSL